MKVFVGGNVYDSRRHVIGVVLGDGDKENIANMLPGATVYAEFVIAGNGAPGTRGFSAESVEALLSLVKAQPEEEAGKVDWIDDGVEE